MAAIARAGANLFDEVGMKIGTMVGFAIESIGFRGERKGGLRYSYGREKGIRRDSDERKDHL